MTLALVVVSTTDLLDLIECQLILTNTHGLALQLGIRCRCRCGVRDLHPVGALEVGLGQMLGDSEVDDVLSINKLYRFLIGALSRHTQNQVVAGTDGLTAQIRPRNGAVIIVVLKGLRIDGFPLERLFLIHINLRLEEFNGIAELHGVLTGTFTVNKLRTAPLHINIFADKGFTGHAFLKSRLFQGRNLELIKNR